FAVFKWNRFPNGAAGIDRRSCRKKNQTILQMTKDHERKVREAKDEQPPTCWNNSWPHISLYTYCIHLAWAQSYRSRGTLPNLARKARTRVSYSCRAARCRSTCPALGTNQTSFGFRARSASICVSMALVFLSFSPLMMNTGHSTFAM